MTQQVLIDLIPCRVHISSKNFLLSLLKRQSQGFVIIFDMTRKESFVNLSKWIQTVYSKAMMENPPIVVLGNKVDQDHNFEVDSKDIEEFRNKHPLVALFEVSARSGFMVNEAFVELCIKMIDVKKSFSGMKLRPNRHSKPITDNTTEEASNGKGIKKPACCK